MIYILDKARILCRSTFRKDVISGFINKKPPARNMEHYPNHRRNTWSETKFKMKDNVSDDYKIVYREISAMNGLIVIGYYAGWVGLAVNISTLGYFIYDRNSLQKRGLKGVLHDESKTGPFTLVQQGFLWFTSTIVTVILIYGSRMLPFRIYHNPKEKMFKAVFVRDILGKKRIETFGEGTLEPAFKQKDGGKVFFKMNNRIALIDQEFFPVPYVYEQMLRKTK
ncbi:hypothetical protein PUN28_011135 [Cardiocondyla obscurior]|uniref:Transmembrane protein 223 n=1 Tax=Cardiocondyla obscurior TaxID=286306 RepID=A0AAW2FMU0_9HYME